MSAPACFVPTEALKNSAPELLKALIYVTDVLMHAHDHDIPPVEWESARFAAMDQARAAIAKAEGRA